MKILLTGGLGYIGSHTAVELIKAGHNAVVVDNLANSKIQTKTAIEKITGKKLRFYKLDLMDYAKLDKVFKKEKFDAVIHFAGLKSVNESISIPEKYYSENIGTMTNVLLCMAKYNVDKLVFSSSATVYQAGEKLPYSEKTKLGACNPYGETKVMIEKILDDYSKAHKDAKIIILRYFNPVGAHESGLIGEDPNGRPNNLMPFITRVAVGKLPKLKIFGNDYKTPDGTAVRDFVHVCDLAEAHVLALNKADEIMGKRIYNIGAGKGYSVLEVVNCFNKYTSGHVDFEFAPRREGDVAEVYASINLAKKELGYKPKRGLKEMCRSSLEYEIKNMANKK